MAQYHIRRAELDQAAESFVWLHSNGRPSGETRDRFLARIHHRRADGLCFEAVVEVRMIDHLGNTRRKKLLEGWDANIHSPLIRISKHYRELLGVEDGSLNVWGQAGGERTVELGISSTRNWFDALNACLLHPQIVVRIATRLGILGAIGLPAGIAPGCSENVAKWASIAVLVISWIFWPTFARPLRAGLGKRC